MASAAMVDPLFVYGSLLAPEVLSALLKRVPASSPAVVQDYHRYNLRGRIYPAVTASKGSKVIGKVLLDLSAHEVGVLDDFEDVEYHREFVEPQILDNINVPAKPLSATMYVWNNAEDKDLYGDWDYEMWREKHLEEFLAQYL